MAVQGLREHQLAPAGLMNDFLFAVPSCLGAVLQTLALSPIGVPLRVCGVVNPSDENPGTRAASTESFYIRQIASVRKSANHPGPVKVPTAVSVFPDELYQTPRNWAERAYPNLIHYNKGEKGGHFAAWEQPNLFTEEVRAGFRSLRKLAKAA